TPHVAILRVFGWKSSRTCSTPLYGRPDRMFTWAGDRTESGTPRRHRGRFVAHLLAPALVPILSPVFPPAVPFLAEAATPGDFAAARTQMGFSLGWHIIIASFGVAMPAITLFMDWRGQRTGDVNYRLLARRWARAMGVLFAVG